MPTHVMIDLETWGTDLDAIVISIGAVKFDPEWSPLEDRPDPVVVDMFHVGVLPKSAQALGFKADADTVMWWMDPKRDEARASWLALEKVDYGTALAGFLSWYGDTSLPTWSNAVSFDVAILKHQLTKLNLPCPWAFWNERCYRTLKNLSSVPYPSEEETQGIAHSALGDAYRQAIHTQAICRQINMPTALNPTGQGLVR